jgi:hypothetical protein
VDPAVVAASIIAVVVVAVRQIVVIGRACRRATTELVRQLPPGSRVVIRFDDTELHMLVVRPQTLPGRSETGQ